MAPNFSKNAILKGDIDFFCLVCEAYIKSPTECEAHISNEGHRKNFDLTNHVKEFEEDFIRKIKTKYFCEVCNKILSVLARVRLHVNESSHLEKKNIGWLKRIENVVIAFDKIVLDEYSWHGLRENSCSICDTECDDLDEHKTLSTHIINLFQTKVEFDKNENVYRKIDESSFQCLTCNLVNTLSNITSHFESQTHKELYQICVNAYKSHEKNIKQNDQKPCNSSNTSKEKKSKENKEEMKKEPTTSQELEVIIEIRPSNSSNGIRKTSKETKEKPKQDSTYEFDDQWEDRVSKVLRTKEYITRDENNQPWCILCDWIMAPSQIQHHLNGNHHQSILKLHKNRVEMLKRRNSNNNNEDVTAKLIDSAEDIQKNNITLNFETKTAFCKTCSIKLDYDYDAIYIHILGHKKLQMTHPETQKEKNFFIPQHRIDKHNAGTLFSSPVVLKRKTKVENEEKNNTEGTVKEKTETNNNNLEITPPNVSAKEESNDEQLGETSQTPVKKSKSTVEMLPSKEYIEHVMVVRSVIYMDVIINDKLCINKYSYLFMIFGLDKASLKCYACDENFRCSAIKDHCAMSKHETAVKEAQVVAHLDTEFVRELRPGQFHCGFCNTFQPSWLQMETHLASPDHRDSKNDASWRLQRYQPEMAKGLYEELTPDVYYANMINEKFF